VAVLQPGHNAAEMEFDVSAYIGRALTTVQEATSSANLYSLIETAKANNVKPCAYLKRVFEALPGAERLEYIETLLPWNMTAQDGFVERLPI